MASALEQYVERKNEIREAFGFETIQWPLTQQGVREVHNYLDADCSPENLTCDGEASREQVRDRKDFYTRVQQELSLIGAAHVG